MQTRLALFRRSRRGKRRVPNDDRRLAPSPMSRPVRWSDNETARAAMDAIVPPRQRPPNGRHCLVRRFEVHEVRHNRQRTRADASEFDDHQTSRCPASRRHDSGPARWRKHAVATLRSRSPASYAANARRQISNRNVLRQWVESCSPRVLGRRNNVAHPRPSILLNTRADSKECGATPIKRNADERSV